MLQIRHLRSVAPTSSTTAIKDCCLVQDRYLLFWAGDPQSPHIDGIFYIDLDKAVGRSQVQWRPVSFPTPANTILKFTPTPSSDATEDPNSIRSLLHDKNSDYVLVTKGTACYQITFENAGDVHVRILLPQLTVHDLKLHSCRHNQQPLLAFVANGSIFVDDLSAAGNPMRVTAPTLKGICCGISEYVMQEEFGRLSGYEWGPCTHVVDSSHLQRIFFLKVDERFVDLAYIGGHSTVIGGPDIVNGIKKFPEVHRYPQAGRPNASSELWITEFDPLTAKELQNSTERAFMGHGSLYKLFPWVEYIVRFGWVNSEQ